MAAIALLGVAGTAVADHAPIDVPSYTGCLTMGGTLVHVAEGGDPSKRCGPNESVVHLGGGDITAVRTGPGLVGGGDAGEVTISLDPDVALPVGCAVGEIAERVTTGWACATDDDTTYTAGTGLALVGDQLSIQPGYRLPQGCSVDQVARLSGGSWSCATVVAAGQSCPAGQVVRAVNAGGSLTCVAAPSGQVSMFEVAGAPRQGVLSDGVTRTFLDAGPLPAGTAQLVFKGEIASDRNVDTGPFEDSRGTVRCSLVVNGTEVDHVALFRVHLNEVPSTPFTLVAVAPGGSSASVRCRADSIADGIELRQPKLVVTRTAP